MYELLRDLVAAIDRETMASPGGGFVKVDRIDAPLNAARRAVARVDAIGADVLRAPTA